jgi:hypothetical protein
MNLVIVLAFSMGSTIEKYVTCVACTEEMRNPHRIFAAKPERKIPFWEPYAWVEG